MVWHCAQEGVGVQGGGRGGVCIGGGVGGRTNQKPIGSADDGDSLSGCWKGHQSLSTCVWQST